MPRSQRINANETTFGKPETSLFQRTDHPFILYRDEGHLDELIGDEHGLPNFAGNLPSRHLA